MTESERNDLKSAVETLRRGGVIIYPTDTVWGIGCDATCDAAVKRIFEIKRRADSKALITLVDSLAALERVVADVPDAAYQLIEAAIDPITIVYDKASAGVSRLLLAEDGSIGVRLTKEDFSAALCRNLRRPLVSTSVNISGQAAPTDFNSINAEILAAVDYVCTSHRDRQWASKPSTVIKISDGGVFKILRK